MSLKTLLILIAILIGLGSLFLVYGVYWYFHVEDGYSFQGAGTNYMIASIPFLVIGIVLLAIYTRRRRIA